MPSMHNDRRALTYNVHRSRMRTTTQRETLNEIMLRPSGITNPSHPDLDLSASRRRAMLINSIGSRAEISVGRGRSASTGAAQAK